MVARCYREGDCGSLVRSRVSGLVVLSCSRRLSGSVGLVRIGFLVLGPGFIASSSFSTQGILPFVLVVLDMYKTYTRI